MLLFLIPLLILFLTLCIGGIYIAYQRHERLKHSAENLQKQMKAFHTDYLKNKAVFRPSDDSTDSLTFE